MKDKYDRFRLSDSLHSPQIVNCQSFNILKKILKVIQRCSWEGGRVRQKKLTKFRTTAFFVTRNCHDINAENVLQSNSFEYVLSAAFSQDSLEKVFRSSQAESRWQFLHIDVVDVIAAGKAQHLRQLVKRNVVPVEVSQLDNKIYTNTLIKNATAA